MIKYKRVHPKPTVSVVIATYGEEEWYLRAEHLANGEWPGLNFTEVITCHADTLAEARNAGAGEARGRWLVFLDADDWISPGYVAEVSRLPDWEIDILCPSVRGFRMVGKYDLEWIDPEPVLPKVTKLIKQNYLPIGSFIKYEMFEQAGGFDDKWPVLEDWAFWLKCEKAGARFGQIPDAVYCINDDHLRSHHPNSDAVAQQIRAEYR